MGQRDACLYRFFHRRLETSLGTICCTVLSNSFACSFNSWNSPLLTPLLIKPRTKRQEHLQTWSWDRVRVYFYTRVIDPLGSVIMVVSKFVLPVDHDTGVSNFSPFHRYFMTVIACVLFQSHSRSIPKVFCPLSIKRATFFTGLYR